MSAALVPDLETIPLRCATRTPQAHLQHAARRGWREVQRKSEPMPDPSTSRCIMHGARDAMADGLAHIEESSEPSSMLARRTCAGALLRR